MVTALIVIWLLSWAALAPAQEARGSSTGMETFEDALNGSTKGKQEGGEFVAGGGWRVVNPFDRILIGLPRGASDGSVFEIDIRNLDVPKQRDAGENFLFGLWEQSDGEAGGDQNQPSRDCFYIYAGTKYPQFKLKFHTHGFGWFEKTYEPIASFDPQHTYRFRVEWKDRVVKVSIDGRLVVSWESPAFDPMDRFKLICVGANPGVKTAREALRGPIFSNVRVVMPAPVYPAAPADLIVAHLSAAGPRLEWQPPTEANKIKHYQVLRDGKPARTTSATSYTDGRLADGEYSYAVKAVYASGKTSPASNTVKVNVVAPSVEAKRATLVKIDGRLDEKEWDVSRRVFKQLKGASADGVRFGALWDDECLYVGVRVADAKLVNDSVELTDDDAIEILIDGNNNGAPFNYRQRQFDDADRQFVKRVMDGGLFVKRGQEQGQYLAGGQVDGVRHAWAKVDGGYSIELAVSWASLGLKPGEVKSLGFDVRRYDDDDGGEADAGAVWQSEHLNSLITSAYGDLILKPAATNANTARQ